jgi:hypothetical protein
MPGMDENQIQIFIVSTPPPKKHTILPLAERIFTIALRY